MDEDEFTYEDNGNDNGWDEQMIEFRSKAEDIKRRIEEHAEKVEEVTESMSQVLGSILVSEIEEYLSEQE